MDKDKNTQFIVTMDGYHPNAFLAKKLMTEGLLNDAEDVPTKPPNVLMTKDTAKAQSKDPEQDLEKSSPNQKKRKTSVESETQVIVKIEDSKAIEKRKSIEETTVKEESPPLKKRKKSPIVFDVDKKEKEKGKELEMEKEKEKEKIVEVTRERTESVSSDSHVVVTNVNSHKYDSVPPCKYMIYNILIGKF